MKDAGYVSAVSCVNAESNSQVTDLPSGLVIASVDYPLILDVFNWGRDLPQFVTHHSLILLSKVEQTSPLQLSISALITHYYQQRETARQNTIRALYKPQALKNPNMKIICTLKL